MIARLSPDQTERLTALGVPVVVPTAIPEGFEVVALEVTATGEGPGDMGYGILYRDDRDRCFVVEYTAGGVGGTPATEYRLPVKPPLFEGATVGYGLNYGPYVDPELRSQFPEPELISDWMEGEAGFYRFAGVAYINDVLMPAISCEADIEPETAVQLIESMTILTPEILGDGNPNPLQNSNSETSEEP
jgi:hypothetical protein